MSACEHERPPSGSPLCEHLASARTDISYVRWYVGVGLDVDLLCLPCAEARGQGRPVSVARACEACFDRVATDLGDLFATRGTPAITERMEPLDATLIETRLPTDTGEVLDLAAIDGDGDGWLLLGAGGRLIRFDAATLASSVVAVATLVSETSDQPYRGKAPRPRLHVSRRGEFAAIVNDYGQRGEVLDLTTGRVTRALDGGDYHPDTVPFSFAFVEHRGRTVAIHRTAWNRLDASDAATGALLTERGPTRYGRGEERPPHYLDYFHGALHVSPDGSRVLDDGWVWHPAGVPMTWSVRAWLDGNVWEAEDGPSKLDLCVRDDWDAPVVWLDESKVVLSGIGDDETKTIAGARLFDVAMVVTPEENAQWRRAREVISFAGPAGPFFSDGRHLYAAGADGLSRWDPTDGARTGRVPGFRPTHHHRGARELVELRAGVLVRWKLPP